MKPFIKIGLLFLCAVLSCSCSLFGSSSSAGAPSGGVPFKANAMSASIKGDPQLNLYQNRPHPVYLCIYQLKDPNGFNQLAGEKDGIEKLMECSRFDGSVAYAKRLVVQPGQELTEKGDRAEGARFLGVVAGYYDLQKEHVIRLNPISKSKFTMALELGPRQIQNIKVK